MPGSDKPKFKLLSDAQFWKLANGEKLQYLKTAFEQSRRVVAKGRKKPLAKQPK